MKLFARILFTAAGLASTLPLAAQAFEVAVVKENHSGSGGSNFPRLRNGTLVAQNVSLSMLIQAAYDLGSLEISGPEWTKSDKFDVSGKAPAGVPDSDLTPLLQALLKDRFKLAAHREFKEMPVFEMTALKSGVKILPFDPAHPPTPPAGHAAAMMIGAGPMPQLARMLASSAGRPVVDKTGLEGRYSYVLTFTPFGAQVPENMADSAAPDLFAAVQQQLGLKREPKKGSVEILVVDSAERFPAEN